MHRRNPSTGSWARGDAPLCASTSRRHWLRTAAAVGFAGASGWLGRIAAAAQQSDSSTQTESRRPACIVLWMAGGPSQIDTFDPKPGHENGGSFRPIATAVPGVQFCEHLPKLAKRADRLAVIRSMKTREGDHERATYLAHTGRRRQGPIDYPVLGAFLSKELSSKSAELPNFVSVAPATIFGPATYGPGYLGPQFAPLVVGGTPGAVAAARQNGEESSDLRVANLSPPPGVSDADVAERLALWERLETDFVREHDSPAALAHREAYQAASRLMKSDAGRAFDLDEEPAAVRERYGRSTFGRGCLLARRLVERGVPFVEVSLNGVDAQAVLGWDTHANNFDVLPGLCGVLDAAFAALIDDLQSRGLWDSTLIVWMGDFGRTPKINGMGGRDHFPAAWSTVLSGGLVRGGQVVGRTSGDGMTVTERPVSVPDLLATVCRALKIDPATQNMSRVGRPIPLVDPSAKPIEELGVTS